MYIIDISYVYNFSNVLMDLCLACLLFEITDITTTFCHWFLILKWNACVKNYNENIYNYWWNQSAYNVL